MIKTICLLIMLLIMTCAVNAMEVNSDNFEEEVLESKVPVVIDFWASWCKPCEKMAVTLERLAKIHKNVKFVKVNVDKVGRKFLNQFRPLRGLPLLVFYKDGKEVGRTLGLVPFITIHSKIIPLLKREKKEDKKDDCDGGVCPPPEGY